MGSGRLVVSDLDGTLLGDDEALARFAAWHAVRRGQVRLAYATGRSVEAVEALVRATPLPRPDAYITHVGTEIHDARGRSWPSWDHRFDGWDADIARAALADEPWLTPQPAVFQTRRKASYFAAGLSRGQVSRVRHAVAATGLAARVLYSCDLYLDVLPEGAGKGPAAEAVALRFGIDRDGVLVFGDTGNDLDLFDRGFRGTVVGNALPELVAAAGDAYRSPEPFANGVLDGLRHWLPDRLQPVRLEEAADRIGHL